MAGFALTVKKAQGLMIEGGVVINLGGTVLSPCVQAWFTIRCLHAIGGFRHHDLQCTLTWEDFEKRPQMLRMRQNFVARLEKMHVASMVI